MQRRLSQIAAIPNIIQSTLESVAKTFDAFLPPEPIIKSSTPSETQTPIDDTLSIDSLDNNYSTTTTGDDSTEAAVAEQTDDSVVVDYENDGPNDVQLSMDFEANEPIISEVLIEFTPEPTPEPELTEEQILKLEKQIKVIFLIEFIK